MEWWTPEFMKWPTHRTDAVLDHVCQLQPFMFAVLPSQITIGSYSFQHACIDAVLEYDCQSTLRRGSFCPLLTFALFGHCS
eukprot:714320-Amphidinium_carterae.1